MLAVVPSNVLASRSRLLWHDDGDGQHLVEESPGYQNDPGSSKDHSRFIFVGFVCLNLASVSASTASSAGNHSAAPAASAVTADPV
jgi:hypothetical protein